MLEFVLGLHSGVRYLVLLVALAAVIAAVMAGRPGRPASRTHDRVYTVFVGLLDLQVVVGIVLLMLRGFYPQLMGHIFTMLLAIVVAHGFGLAARNKERERMQPATGLRVAGVLVTIVLVIGGIMAIGRPIL